MDQTTDFELVAERVAKNLIEYLRDFDKVAEFAYSIQYTESLMESLTESLTYRDFEHLVTIL